MIIETTLQDSLTTRSPEELVAIKQDALHQAARYPIGSLRRLYWLGLADRITALLGYKLRHDLPPQKPGL